MKGELVRGAAWFALGSLALIALVGLAHTRWGRPLLALLSGAPGCPVQDLDPKELEERRISWGLKRAGSGRSPARPALGFELGVSRRAEVQAWLRTHGAQCTPARKGTALDCKNLRDDRTLAGDAYLQFDEQDRLVAVDVFREPRSAVEAVELIALTERRLARTIGAATALRGERSPAFLGSAPFRQLALEYRYADYVGRVAATNLGSRGLRVREQYQWFPIKSGSS